MKIRQFNPAPIVLIGLVSAACTSTALATSSPRFTQAATEQQPSADQVTVPLSDPSRPGLIDISLVQRQHHGARHQSEGRAGDRPSGNRPAEPALRPGRHRACAAFRRPRASASPKTPIASRCHRIARTARSPSRSRRRRAANLKLSTVNGGEILVENIEGELTVSNTNGGITLNNVAGTVNAGTTNGSVRASMTRVTADKDMAFTSLNGTVDVTLPPNDEGEPANAQRQR